MRIGNLIWILILTLPVFSCSNPTVLRDKTSEKYNPDWRSVQQYEVPEWFNDAKLGIFIHWGPYAVPICGNEWYSCRMYDTTFIRREGKKFKWHYYKHHKETFGNLKDFSYKDFIPMFKAEKFDPVEWLDILEKAGAKYIVPVGEHYDGFAKYASKITKWNVKEMGAKRDIVGELAYSLF